MAANIWNSIAGYVIIDIEGAYLERLINSITKSGIEIFREDAAVYASA